VLKYVAQPYSFTMIDRGMPALAAPAHRQTAAVHWQSVKNIDSSVKG
jgi:hypothetical protein